VDIGSIKNLGWAIEGPTVNMSGSDIEECEARVGSLVPFHFSARYRDRADELTREAEEAFSVSESLKLPG
jgi:hypothetical protein